MNSTFSLSLSFDISHTFPPNAHLPNFFFLFHPHTSPSLDFKLIVSFDVEIIKNCDLMKFMLLACSRGLQQLINLVGRAISVLETIAAVRVKEAENREGICCDLKSP